jgi:hypothetical protein
MVLMCEIGIVEGKPQVEGYAAGELAARADLVVPGAGPLAGMLAALVREVAGPGAAGWSLEELERRVVAGVRVLGCAVLQHAVDARAAAEVRRVQVTGADGGPRPRAVRGARTIVTVLGPVRVRRIGYRTRAGGVPGWFPADAALNLPRRRYSWGLQQLAVLFTQAVSYERARQFVRAATGVSIGKRQLEQITAEAAADAAGFEPALPPEQAGPLVISPDAKGVAMRPQALRRRGAKGPGARVRNFAKRRGTGEKGHKRMARAGAVFDVAVPDQPRTPEQILARQPGQPPPQPPKRPARGIPAISPAGPPGPSPRCPARPGAGTRPGPGPGSRWPTGTTTRSGRSSARPRPAAWPAPSPPAATWTTTGTTTSPANASATTTAATSPAASSPHDPGHPKEPHPCHIVVHLTTTMSYRRGPAAPAAGTAVTGMAEEATGERPELPGDLGR